MSATSAPRRETAVRVGPTGIVRAIVAVTGVMDEVNDILVPGAATLALRERRPKVVRHHDWQKMAGKVLRSEELMPGDRRLPKLTPQGTPWPAEAGALVATMQYNLRTPSGKEAYEWVRFYAESNEACFSIGYRVDPRRTQSKGGIRYIGGLSLYEYSDVLHGAHPMTMALEVKNADPRGLQYKVAPQMAWGARVMSPAAFAVLEAKSLPLENKAAAWAVLEAKAMTINERGTQLAPRRGSGMPGSGARRPAPKAPTAPKARPTASTAGRKTTPSGRVSRAQDPTFNEELHPRAEAGQPNGGQFVAKGDGYKSTGKADRAQDVRLAQAGLIKNGLLGPNDGRGGVGADGLFGGKTENAVRAWQKSKGYQETGKLDQGQYDELTERKRGTSKRGAGTAKGSGSRLDGRQRRSSAPDRYGRTNAPIKDRYGRPKYSETPTRNPDYNAPVGQVTKKRAPGVKPGTQQAPGKAPSTTPKPGVNGRPGATPGRPQGSIRPQPNNDTRPKKKPAPKKKAPMQTKSAWDTVMEAKSLHDTPEMESKGMHQEMAGSYEALRDALSAAAREKLTKGKGDEAYSCVEATYPDHIIVTCHCDAGPAKTYRIPYTQTGAGVKLGEPVEVEISVVAVPTGDETVSPATADEVDAVRFVAPAGAMLDDATNLLMLGGLEGKAIDGLMDPLVRLLDALAVKGLDVAQAILGDEALPDEGGEGLEYDGSEDDAADSDEGDAPFKGAAPKFGKTEEKVLVDPADIAAELAELAA